MPASKLSSYLLRGLFLLLILLLLSISYLGIQLRRTLPNRQGRTVLSELQKPARVDFDKRGVPTIFAETIVDAVRIQGYLTAQDRLFQLDLGRRKALGKLSEVFGKAALEIDTLHRRFRYGEVARAAYLRMDPEPRAHLEAYAAGVNQVIRENHIPWEMRLLGYTPEPWQPEDALLFVLNMYETLNHQDSTDEVAMTALRKKLPASAVEYLTPEFGFFDSPILPQKTPFPKVPPPPNLNLRANLRSPLSFPDASEIGSNGWALSGKRTLSGKPILAGDPHLDLNVPTLWYRLQIRVGDLSIVGAALPGLPGVIIGTNRLVAWTFTNTMSDNADWIELSEAESAEHYLYEGKSYPLTRRLETIGIRGGEGQEVSFLDSPWGPVTQHKNGKFRVLQWAALDPVPLSGMDIMRLNRSKTLKEVSSVLEHWAGPTQNAIIASREGEIGWVLVGHIPQRIGFDGRSTVERDSSHQWKGYLPFEIHPRSINPPEGLVVSGNQRPVPIDSKTYLFGQNWPNSNRAYRIRELLESESQWTPEKVLGVQLDTFSHTHVWYRDRWTKCHPSLPSDPWLSASFSLVKNWKGSIRPHEPAYPLLKEFRFQIANHLITPLAEFIDSEHKDELADRLSTDYLAKRLLELEPPSLLPKPFETYCELLDFSMKEAAKKLVPSPSDLQKLDWALINRAAIRHPLSRALPGFVGKLLNFPESPLPGDTLVPNVTKPSNGASFRMVVDLGNIESSLFLQPGGQSGNFLSENYKDQFEDWLEGKPAPLLPGSAVHTITLEAY